ncbi:hypothetical protein BROUX41_003971 [Berkeleyomyces rouxiae]
MPEKKGFRGLISRLSGNRSLKHSHGNPQVTTTSFLDTHVERPSAEFDHLRLPSSPQFPRSPTASELSPLPSHVSYQPTATTPAESGPSSVARSMSGSNHGSNYQHHHRHRSANTVSPLLSGSSNYRRYSQQSGRTSNIDRLSVGSDSRASRGDRNRESLSDLQRLYKMCPISAYNEASLSILREFQISQTENLDVILHTCVLITAHSNNTDLMGELIAYGGSIGPEVRGQNHETILHVAARTGQLLMVEWLVKNGAVLNAKDSTGSTPDQTATMYSNFACTAVIEGARRMQPPLRMCTSLWSFDFPAIS